MRGRCQLMAPRGLNQMLKASKRPSDPLSGLIDQYFLTRTEQAPVVVPSTPHVRAGGRFTPSSCGDPDKCMRASVFAYMQVPKTYRRDAEQELIFLTGDYAHMMWFNLFTHMEQVLGSDVFQVVGIEQLTARRSLYLAGWYDIHVRINGVDYLVDFKTINSRGFAHLLNTRAPNRGNVGQLVRYLHCKKIQRGILMYLNKDTCQWKIFTIKASAHKEVWSYTVQWIRKAIRYMERQKLPPMHEDCTKGSRMAKGCGWAHLCYGPNPVSPEEAAYAHGASYKDLWQQTTGIHLEEQ